MSIPELTRRPPAPRPGAIRKSYAEPVIASAPTTAPLEPSEFSDQLGPVSHVLTWVSGAGLGVLIGLIITLIIATH